MAPEVLALALTAIGEEIRVSKGAPIYMRVLSSHREIMEAQVSEGATSVSAGQIQGAKLTVMPRAECETPQAENESNFSRQTGRTKVAPAQLLPPVSTASEPAISPRLVMVTVDPPPSSSPPRNDWDKMAPEDFEIVFYEGDVEVSRAS
jgi:hypothetical protein